MKFMKTVKQKFCGSPPQNHLSSYIFLQLLWFRVVYLQNIMIVRVFPLTILQTGKHMGYMICLRTG